MTFGTKKILIILFSLVILSGCAGVSRENMVPTITTDPSVTTGKTLQIKDVQGGREETNFITESYFVNRALFSDLIEQTIISTRLFTLVSRDKPGDYVLESKIIEVAPNGWTVWRRN